MKRLAGIMMFVCFILALVQCGQKDKPAGDGKKPETKMEMRYVTAKGGLRMREKPDTGAAVVDTVPEGEAVEFLEETGNDVTISGATGKWSRIKWKGKSGWGFGGFLSAQVKPAGGGALPDSMLKGYSNTGPVEPGNMPARITVGKTVIARYYGGSMTSHSYCIINSVVSSGNRYSITCSDRGLSESEKKEFMIESGAEKMKKMEITREAGDKIRVDGSEYKPGSGL